MEKKRKTKEFTDSHSLLGESVPNGLKQKPEIFILYYYNEQSKKYEIMEFKTKPQLILFIKVNNINDPIAYKGVRIGNLE